MTDRGRPALLGRAHSPLDRRVLQDDPAGAYERGVTGELFAGPPRFDPLHDEQREARSFRSASCGKSGDTAISRHLFDSSDMPKRA